MLRLFPQVGPILAASLSRAKFFALWELGRDPAANYASRDSLCSPRVQVSNAPRDFALPKALALSAEGDGKLS